MDLNSIKSNGKGGFYIEECIEDLDDLLDLEEEIDLIESGKTALCMNCGGTAVIDDDGNYASCRDCLGSICPHCGWLAHECSCPTGDE